MVMNVKRADSGRARMTMKAPRKERSSRYRTRTTNNEPMNRASETVWMLFRTMSDRR